MSGDVAEKKDGITRMRALDNETKADELNDSEKSRIESLRYVLDKYYTEIPERLRDYPDAQQKCLELLSEAEKYLTPPIYRSNVVDARLTLTKIDIEVGRSKAAKNSFGVVAFIVYLFAVLIVLGVVFGFISTNMDGSTMNGQLVMGVPLPILIWSAIGSLTSMLIRAGNFPFADRNEAMRWLLFRPIVGIVMGVLTYLMVVAGLIVFAGIANPKAPELLWVIAFVGSFSDTLSINLLQKMLGKFESAELVTKKTTKHEAKKNADLPE